MQSIQPAENMRLSCACHAFMHRLVARLLGSFAPETMHKAIAAVAHMADCCAGLACASAKALAMNLSCMKLLLPVPFVSGGAGCCASATAGSTDARAGPSRCCCGRHDSGSLNKARLLLEDCRAKAPVGGHWWCWQDWTACISLRLSRSGRPAGYHLAGEVTPD